jgi:hypothetical protein
MNKQHELNRNSLLSSQSLSLFAISPKNSNILLYDYTTEEMIGTTIYAGEPTLRAKQINARQFITKSNIYNINGEPMNVNDIIGRYDCDHHCRQQPTTSVVVFLRSLG